MKNYDKIWEKVEKLMRIDFESTLVYSDNDKYIKLKKKKDMQAAWLQIFITKKCQKKKHHINLH